MRVNLSNSSLQNRYFSGTGSIGGIHLPDFNDKYVFSSTVEGDGRNTPRMEFYFGRKRGAGIKDEYVHLYCGNLKDGFKEIQECGLTCITLFGHQ